MNTKPLGRKAYGSIAHLPGSRLGISDKLLHEGQVKIITEKKRKDDRIIVQEKLDGSCVAVAKIDNELIPISRAGYRIETSRWKQHHYFRTWFYDNVDRFDKLLKNGERAVGEWLSMAHGIKYKLFHDPFVLFDIMTESTRIPDNEFLERNNFIFVTPYTFSIDECVSMETIKILARESYHGGEHSEGVVIRVEHEGKVDFLGKWVNPEHVCGRYFNNEESKLIYNWKPNETNKDS